MWVGMKIVAPGNPMNSLVRTLGVAALACAISFMPLWPLLALAAMATAAILLKVYELTFGQTIAVMVSAVLANIALVKALSDYLSNL
jgi:hypothetical protein